MPTILVHTLTASAASKEAQAAGGSPRLAHVSTGERCAPCVRTAEGEWLEVSSSRSSSSISILPYDVGMRGGRCGFQLSSITPASTINTPSTNSTAWSALNSSNSLKYIPPDTIENSVQFICARVPSSLSQPSVHHATCEANALAAFCPRLGVVAKPEDCRTCIRGTMMSAGKS